jgi:hypothetical protein
MDGITQEPRQLKKYFSASELKSFTTLICLASYVDEKIVANFDKTSLYNQREQRHLVAASYHLALSYYDLLNRMDNNQIGRAIRTMKECSLVTLPHAGIAEVRRQLRELDKRKTFDRTVLEELYVGISGSLCQNCTIKEFTRCRLRKALINADAPMYDEFAEGCGYAFQGDTEVEEFLLSDEDFDAKVV